MPRWLHGTETPLPAWADENGLVALGGTLEPERLLSAYRAGVFPWSSQPVPSWWSPDPRAVFDLNLSTPRSVRRSASRGGWRFTLDQDFTEVMRGCAHPAPGRPERQTTWITPDFVAAYEELHRRGHAHSIEVHEGDALVGGLYGVAIGGYFGGESMFHRRADASKAALFYLIERLRLGGFRLLDAQAMTPHLARIGARPVPRAEYLTRLRTALALPARLLPDP